MIVRIESTKKRKEVSEERKGEIAESGEEERLDNTFHSMQVKNSP